MTPQSRMTSTTTTTTTTENINILIANSGLSAPILVETRQLGLWINGTAAVQLCDCQVTSSGNYEISRNVHNIQIWRRPLLGLSLC